MSKNSSKLAKERSKVESLETEAARQRVALAQLIATIRDYGPWSDTARLASLHVEAQRLIAEVEKEHPKVKRMGDLQQRIIRSREPKVGTVSSTFSQVGTIYDRSRG